MTQMPEQLKDWAIVGMTDDHGLAWWYHMFGGEMGRNHFEQGVPVDLVREKLAKLEPQAVSIGFQSPQTSDSDESVWRDSGRKGVYIPEFDNLAYIGSDGYRIHRLAEVFGPVLALVNGEIQIRSLVAANGGSLVSLQLTSPQSYETCGMKYNPSLFVYTDHSGKLGTGAKGAKGFAVCDNTQAMVLGEKTEQAFKVKHTRNSVTESGALKAQFVTELGDLAKKIGYEIEKLNSVTVSDDVFEAWLAEYFPYPRQDNFNGTSEEYEEKHKRALTMARNKRNEVREMYRTDRRCAPWRGTALGVLQTANTYQSHEAPIRAATRLSRNLENLLSGAGEQKDQFAMLSLKRVLQAA